MFDENRSCRWLIWSPVLLATDVPSLTVSLRHDFAFEVLTESPSIKPARSVCMRLRQTSRERGVEVIVSQEIVFARRMNRAHHDRSFGSAAIVDPP